MNLVELRQGYHEFICSKIIHVDNDGIPNIGDKSSNASKTIATGIINRITGNSYLSETIVGQTSGSLFEIANRDFLEKAFRILEHIRPGDWNFDATGNISQFQQYKHLAELSQILDQKPELKTVFGTDYLIKPDIIITRSPITDNEINLHHEVIPTTSPIAELTPVRSANQQEISAFLHASVSLKWTLRSDRAQNARTEALNLIRNRKGHTPHIVVVTAEPTPGRLASLALGTGDIDCVYHFALPELRASVTDYGNDDTIELLENMIAGDRLRDISDLPLDLII